MITITYGKEDLNNDEDLAEIIKLEAKIKVLSILLLIMISCNTTYMVDLYICKFVRLIYVCCSELAPLFSIRCIPCRGVS